jgi:hypothetical protein
LTKEVRKIQTEKTSLLSERMTLKEKQAKIDGKGKIWLELSSRRRKPIIFLQIPPTNSSPKERIII